MPEPAAASPGDFPRVPAYAWAWLQRSRPILAEAADRLTGQPPSPGFVEDLRVAFAEDAFTRAVLVEVVADIAFHGRIPQRRPPGVSWDRGLTWWAAALAGIDMADFEGRDDGDAAAQRPLFEPVDVPLQTRPARAGRSAERGAPRTPYGERRALAATLRDLVARSDDGHVPVAALQQLIDALEGR